MIQCHYLGVSDICVEYMKIQLKDLSSSSKMSSSRGLYHQPVVYSYTTVYCTYLQVYKCPHQPAEGPSLIFRSFQMTFSMSRLIHKKLLPLDNIEARDLNFAWDLTSNKLCVLDLDQTTSFCIIVLYSIYFTMIIKV